MGWNIASDDAIPFPDARGWLRAGLSSRPIVALDDKPLLEPATHAVYEWSDYLVRYEGANRLRVGDRLVSPIDDGLFGVRFENQLGLTSIEPLDPSGP